MLELQKCLKNKTVSCFMAEDFYFNYIMAKKFLLTGIISISKCAIEPNNYHSHPIPTS